MTRAYEEVVDFLATAAGHDRLSAFTPSPEAKARVEDLIRRQKTTGLSEEESSELSHYLEIEHLLSLAKARAREARSR